MIVEFRSSFLKDIKKIRDTTVKTIILETIENAKNAKTIAEIKTLNPLRDEVNTLKLNYRPIDLAFLSIKALLNF